MKTTPLVVTMILIFASCIHLRAEQFFLTEQHSGHRFGPFQYRAGADVTISGRQFSLSLPANSDKNSELVLKMKKIILPDVDFRQANVRDAIAYTATIAKINMVLSIGQNAISAPAPDLWGEVDSGDQSASGGRGDELPLVTLQATDISVYDLLNIVCELADLEWSIENSVVMIRKHNPEQDKIFTDKWKYDGAFNDLIDAADKIVIRNGGYNCCGPVDDDRIIFTITNREEIVRFNAMIQFKTNQTINACMCCGFPGIDWYRGKYRLALTALQHGGALRWKDFPGDAVLTKQSSHQLSQWLLDHNTPDPHKEFIKITKTKKSPTPTTISSDNKPPANKP
jgi:hypothetical protein